MALEAHAAAAGDHGFLPLVPDPELEADSAPDVQAALVHGPAIGEVAPGDHLEQGALALGGEVHDLGKGGFLLHAADAVGGFGQVEDPDAGHAVDGQLGSGDFLGLDDGGDGGFQELEDIGVVVREEIVQLHRLFGGGVQNHLAEADGIPGEDGLCHGIILSFQALPHSYAEVGQNMPGKAGRREIWG